MAQANIAVIGAGLIGRKHIAVLREGRTDYALAAVCDPAPTAAAIAGIEAPVLSGRDGMMTLASTLAISEAARTQAPVRMDAMLGG